MKIQSTSKCGKNDGCMTFIGHAMTPDFIVFCSDIRLYVLSGLSDNKPMYLSGKSVGSICFQRQNGEQIARKTEACHAHWARRAKNYL